MINKSFEVFSSFSGKEIKDFQQYLTIQHLNKESQLNRLVEAYYKMKEKDSYFTNEELFKLVFRRQRFIHSKLRLLQSELQKQIEGFIVYKSIEEDSVYYKQQILHYYKKKGLENTYSKTLRSYEKFSESRFPGDESNFLEMLELASEKYEVAIQQRKRAFDETNQLVSCMDKDYILRKLKLICLVVSQEKVYNLQFNHGLEEELVRFLEKGDLLNEALMKSYYYCYKMLSGPDEEIYYDQLYNHLKLYFDKFSDAEKTQLYSLSLNFCIRSLNQGRKKYGIKGIQLYEEGVKNGILLNNGKMSRFTFRNVVTMALRIGEYELADEFIMRYQHLLHKKEALNMVKFAQALVRFYKKDYDEASELLLHVRFKDLLFNLAAKGLQLKIYFETGEFLVLDSHLDAMQIFLKRHEDLGYHKQNYLNIISYTRRLMKLKRQSQKLKLAAKLQSESILTEKQWLLEKLHHILL